MSSTKIVPIDETVARIREFNDKYMLVNEGGKAVIYQPGFDSVIKRKFFYRLSVADLKTFYCNDFVSVEDRDGNIKRKNAGMFWLHHPGRLQYIGGIVFDPSMRHHDDTVLNLWQGYTVDPIEGTWSLLREHVKTIICGGDPAKFKYLMGWMARMIQLPGEQGEVAVVMRGGEGTGKGTLAKALLRIFGQHGLAVSQPGQLVGNFNAHLRDAVFLFADEAFFAGNPAHIGALKALITEPYLTIEAKHQNAVQTPNFLHIMMASNEEWVVPASVDSRRFFVMEVSDSRRRDIAYFDAIAREMDNGGYEAMLYELKNYDISDFSIRDVPQTDELNEQRKLSLSTDLAWWKDCLERGYVYKSKHGLSSDFMSWWGSLATEILYSSYEDYARQHRERQVMKREAFGRFIGRFATERKQMATSTIVGEEYTKDGGQLIRKSRPWGYVFGTLNEARERFIQLTKISVEWDDHFE